MEPCTGRRIDGEVHGEIGREWRHPGESARVSALADEAVSLGIYTWPSYRLHRLNKPSHVSWPALEPQFGAGCSRPRAFRANFPAALAAAIAAYPDAKVTLDENGATLHPSPAPVRKLARNDAGVGVNRRRPNPDARWSAAPSSGSATARRSPPRPERASAGSRPPTIPRGFHVRERE